MSAVPPLAYRVEGDGPPVVLLNGGMMTFASWEPIAERLRTRYRLLRFDFRGQLLSAGEPPATLAGHADDLAALLDRVDWPSAHLVATSFGALVAAAFAAAYPQRIRSLALITVTDHATPRFDAGNAEMRAVLTDVLAGGERGRFYDELVAAVYSPAYREREAATIAARRAEVDQLPRAWFAGVDGLLASVDRFDLRAGLAAIHAPARVILTRGDEVMDPERSRELAAALGAELVEHPSAGHALVAEDPEWLAAACLDFLDRLEDGP